MRFMVMVRADRHSEAGQLPDTGMLEAMGKYNEELLKAGILLAGEGLRPSSAGARVKFEAGKTTVTDGPFGQPRELIAGFWLMQVKSQQEVIEWIRRCPLGEGEIEIRQIAELSDFAASDPSGKLREAEVRLRGRLQ